MIMLKNTKNSYGLITKFFHWLIALAIIGLMTVGFNMANMPPSVEKYELYGMHKASGVVVFMLIILRLLWRLANETVQPPKNLPQILATAAKIGHFLLYVFMFSMPISGILMSYFSGNNVSVFGIFTIPAAVETAPKIAGFFHSIHVLGVLAFIAVIILHICAALYHHFIRRDNVLMRMIK
jgi:cytochrome b561